MPGIELALRYSYPPFRLGLCGPQDPKNIRLASDFLAGKRIDFKKIRKFLEQFRAAYPYYKLIASSNGIDDPFDERVVRAYWTGNELLENVASEAIRKMVREEFKMPDKAEQILEGSWPHHSFHVAVIGSITGRLKFDDKLRALCRISWKKIGDDFVSFHWGQACEVLDKKTLANLKKYSQT